MKTMTDALDSAHTLDRSMLLSIENLDLVTDPAAMTAVSDVMLAKILWPSCTAVVLGAWQKIGEKDRQARARIELDLEVLGNEVAGHLAQLSGERSEVVNVLGADSETAQLLGEAHRSLSFLADNARRTRELMELDDKA